MPTFLEVSLPLASVKKPNKESHPILDVYPQTHVYSNLRPARYLFVLIINCLDDSLGFLKSVITICE